MSILLVMLLIPTLFPTINSFSLLTCVPGITIFALYSTGVPPDEISTFRVSFSLAPIRYPPITFSGGTSGLVCA